MIKQIRRKQVAKLHEGNGVLSIWEIPIGCSPDYDEVRAKGVLKSIREKGIFKLVKGGGKDPDQSLYIDIIPIEKGGEGEPPPEPQKEQKKERPESYLGLTLHYPKPGEKRTSPYVLKSVPCDGDGCKNLIELVATVTCHENGTPKKLQLFHATDGLSKFGVLKPGKPKEWRCPVCLGIKPKEAPAALPDPPAEPAPPPAPPEQLIIKGHKIHPATADVPHQHALKTVTCCDCQAEIPLRALLQGKTLQSFRALDGRAKVVRKAGPNTSWGCGECIEKRAAATEPESVVTPEPSSTHQVPKPPELEPEPPELEPEPPELSSKPEEVAPLSTHPAKVVPSTMLAGEDLLAEVTRICEDAATFSDEFCQGVGRMLYAVYGGENNGQD